MPKPARPMPRSASAMLSPVYSQRPPSQRPMPSYRPHIIHRKADMIPSYSSTSSPSSSPSASLTPQHTHSLMISSLQAVGAFGLIILIAMILSAIRVELQKNRRNIKQKAKSELTQSELIIQQINPTAYSKLNLIRRASSNSLSSSGNISPV